MTTIHKRSILLSAFVLLGAAVLASAAPCPQASAVPSPSPEVPNATKVNLGMLRSAVAVYYGDTEGLYPNTLETLIPKYLQSIPVCRTNTLGAKSGVEYYSTDVTTNGKLDPRKIKGTGKWGYVNSRSSVDVGTVFIDIKNYDSVAPEPSKQSNLAFLGILRSAVTMYYGDTEGIYPPNLSVLVPKYLQSIPPVTTCAQGVKNSITIFPSVPKTVQQLKKTGGWGYVPSQGEVFIDSAEDNLFLQ